MDIKNEIKKYLWNKIQSNNLLQWEEIKNLFKLNNIQVAILADSISVLKKENEKDLWLQLDKRIKQHHSGAGLSFSQSGEDMVLRNLLRDKKNGFFVDVGAHHPIRFSNTFYFYLRGWKGINIDPVPGIMDLFNKMRPEDINLEIAVGENGISEFYIFEEGCYNTFDAEIAEVIIKEKISPLQEKVQLPKYRLDEILEKYTSSKKIDFLSIDAEGLDVEILSTNNWKKFRPIYVCAENHTTDPTRPMNPGKILHENGYNLVAQTEFSSIYKDKTA
jgi:FkbM family methyltransferase